ncbi:DNA-binding response regulator [Phaeobacter gallaeciensis]|uniref:DNA-binding response regulator n=2 Tax=Roseobacteraceae TaxID=2854170 RepID=A0A366X5H9_9RHOB|nr:MULTISPECIES: response regulator transcription factor [Roseobacteraceae]MBT3142360.1 response regulator transcription factor [Falsiruegeria litorea]MBT8169412.1 response regulator transcription factor [Falsiruegeria litorea]RBW60641.1 DNA-binding response regulator [Phaeobacter gallaeciensis]
MHLQTGKPLSNPLLSALIVDDHPLFCDALSMTLQAVSSINSMHTVTNLQGALDLISQGVHIDLVVLDLNLPDVNGLDGLLRLRKATKCPIVVVSSMADNRIISSVVHAGAAGFVPKHSQRDVFHQAIKVISDGETFVPAGYVLLEESDITDKNDAMNRLASLTNQQARILQLICEGKLNKQIAFDLSIAETTVKAHVTAIMRKLGVQSRTQAVLIAKKSSFANVLHDSPPTD